MARRGWGSLRESAAHAASGISMVILATASFIVFLWVIMTLVRVVVG